MGSRRSSRTDRSEIRSLPKVELHRHLEGTVRPQTFLELARESGMRMNHLSLYSAMMKPGERGFSKFLKIFPRLREVYVNRDAIERVAREAVEDAARDSIDHLELRFSPAGFSAKSGENPTRVARWIMDAASREARCHKMRVRFIATIARHFPVEVNKPTLTAALDLPFVGMDLAGDERTFPAGPYYKMFQKARKAGLGITIHAGEAGGAENVKEAITKLGASRIGHGIRVLDDPDICRMSRERGIVFEVCPTSNLSTAVVRKSRLRRMWEAGLEITLNTDDPAIFGIDLTNEYKVALREGFSSEDLEKMRKIARKATFTRR